MIKSEKKKGEKNGAKWFRVPNELVNHHRDESGEKASSSLNFRYEGGVFSSQKGTRGLMAWMEFTSTISLIRERVETSRECFLPTGNVSFLIVSYTVI